MSQLPQDLLTAQEVFEWYEVTEQLAKLKQKEGLLRQRVWRHLVPLPEEGTNTVELANNPIFQGVDTGGFVFKGQHKINRDIDEGALTTLGPVFAARTVDGKPAPLPVGKLVKWSPELVLREYRKLTVEEMQEFDQVLIIKPGSPQCEIVLPAALKKKS